MRNLLKVKDLVFIKHHRGIEVHLASGPKALSSKTSGVIRIVVSEENTLIEEVISLELLLPGERTQWLGLKNSS